MELQIRFSPREQRTYRDFQYRRTILMPSHRICACLLVPRGHPQSRPFQQPQMFPPRPPPLLLSQPQPPRELRPTLRCRLRRLPVITLNPGISPMPLLLKTMRTTLNMA